MERNTFNVNLPCIEFIAKSNDRLNKIMSCRITLKPFSYLGNRVFHSMELLVQHRQALDEQIAQLQAHKIKLDEKIEFYSNEIERVHDAPLPKSEYTNSKPPRMV